MRMVKVLSAAILAPGVALDRGSPVRSTNLLLPQTQWSPETLLVDLGSLFGCAFAIVHGQDSYRFAAKGGE
jgi:hypothetical protein